MEGFVKQNSENNESDFDDEESEEGESNESEETSITSSTVDEVEDLVDVNGNKVYSAVQVEDLLSRCLAAISNRGSISSRYLFLLSHYKQLVIYYLSSFSILEFLF